MSSRTPLDRIEQRMALTFAALFTALVVLVVLAGSTLYVRYMADERETLHLLVGDTLAESLQGVQFSGKYRARMVVEQMAAGNEPLAYLSIVDPQGTVIAHSDARRNDGPADAEGLDLVLATIGDGQRRSLLRQVDGVTVSEVIVPLRGGFGNPVVGAVRVGVRSETLREVLTRVAVPMTALVLGALAIMLPGVVLLSRRLGRPIRRQANELRGILQHAPLLISIQDADGRIERASAAFDQLLGAGDRPRRELEELLPGVPPLGPDGQGVHTELHTTIGGQPRVLLSNRFTVATDPSGQVQLDCFMASDVTEQHEAAAQRDRLAAAVEQADDSIIILDRQRRVMFINPACARLTGLSADQARARPADALLGGSEQQQAERLRVTETGRPWRGRVLIATRDHGDVPCSMVLSPILDARGQQRGLVAVLRDTSREEQLEAQLHHSQKMEAVGRLAGGIAHDFNNLLTVLLGRAELLELSLPPDSEQRAAAVGIQETAERAAALTAQLLAFSRRQEFDIQELDTAEVVGGLLPMVRRLIGEDVSVSWQPQPELWPVLADRGKLEQVLLNLVVNARDAMPRGGRLDLSATNRHLAEGSVPASHELIPGDYVVLSVSDTGVGMPEEIQESVFEPFFTTKEVGKGTGLGLALAHGIVRQSQGHIWLESEEGRGTTIFVALPRTRGAGPRDAQEPGPAQVAPPGGSEHVLVVEDDDSVRDVICALLTAAGYFTTPASSGAEALALLEVLPRLPDLVLTDLVMPQMRGTELVARLRRERPDVRVLMMTGYSKELEELQEELGDLPVLRKPPTSASLRRAVREALEA